MILLLVMTTIGDVMNNEELNTMKESGGLSTGDSISFVSEDGETKTGKVKRILLENEEVGVKMPNGVEKIVSLSSVL